MAGPFKVVGADSDGNLPERVLTNLDERYSGGGGSHPLREVAIPYTATVEDLDLGTFTLATGSFEVASDVSILFNISGNGEIWIRFYTDETARDTDLARVWGDPPVDINGLLLDVDSGGIGWLNLQYATPVFLQSYTEEGPKQIWWTIWGPVDDTAYALLKEL